MSSPRQTILQQPVPTQATALARKKGYRSYPLLLSDQAGHEPLVDIGLYGVAGQSYYSRPSRATAKPVEGVDATVYVRGSITRKLAEINYALQESPEIQTIFGRPVELYVDEGFRTRAMQEALYNEVFPRLIKEQYPHMTKEELLQRRSELITKPSNSTHFKTPSPHATGAAVDIKLRYAHPNVGFVADAFVPMINQSPVGPEASPDYFELHPPTSAAEKILQRNRRVFYWVMRGALLGEDSGFVVNPTEWWHWSYGDQMWAALTEAPCAFYGQAEPPV